MKISELAEFLRIITVAQHRIGSFMGEAWREGIAPEGYTFLSELIEMQVEGSIQHVYEYGVKFPLNRGSLDFIISIQISQSYIITSHYVIAFGCGLSDSATPISKGICFQDDLLSIQRDAAINKLEFGKAVSLSIRKLIRKMRIAMKHNWLERIWIELCNENYIILTDDWKEAFKASEVKPSLV